MNVDKRPNAFEKAFAHQNLAPSENFSTQMCVLTFAPKSLVVTLFVMSTSLAVIKKLRLNMMILIYTFAARYTYARNETKLGMKRKPTVISCG